MSDNSHNKYNENASKRHYGLIFAGILVMLLILIGLSGFGVNLLGRWFSYNDMPVFVLPILLLAGAVVLMVTLGFLAAIFATLGLATDKKALALPDGSIRALIALLLIVMFSILSIFLYQQLKNDVNSPEIVVYRNRTEVGKDELLTQIPPEEILVIVTHTPQPATENSQPTPTLNPERFNITRRVQYETNKESQRFAQQVLTTVSTLVVSVASFYFGSRAVAQASDVAQKSAQGAAEERRLETVFEAVQKTQFEAGAAKAQVNTFNKELEEARKILQSKEEARDAADKALEEARQPSADVEQAQYDMEIAKENAQEAQRIYDDAPNKKKKDKQRKLEEAQATFKEAEKKFQNAHEKAAKAEGKLQDAIDKATEAQKAFNDADAEVTRLEAAVAEAQKTAQQAEEKQAFIQQLTLDPTEDNPEK